GPLGDGGPGGRVGRPHAGSGADRFRQRLRRLSHRGPDGGRRRPGPALTPPPDSWGSPNPAGPTIPAFLYRPPAVNERQFAPAAARNDGSRAAPGGSRRLLLDRRPSRFVVFPGGGATFPTGHEAEGGRHQRADPADEDRSPAAGDVGQPAEDRASDRGRADEEDGLD